MTTRTLFALALLICATSAHGQNNDFRQLATFFGRVDFFTTGASMTDNTGLFNGVHCLEPSASVTVPSFGDTERPSLVAAYLLWGGSLIGNDGAGEFDTSAITNQEEYQASLLGGGPINVIQEARSAADIEVELTLPGQSTAHMIRADPAGLYVHTYYKPMGPEQGVIAFYLARSDITEIVADAGSQLSGTWTVEGVRAEVCNGLEAICGTGQTCSSMSELHSNGTASFALILVLEEPSWGLRRVTLFEGLHGLANSVLDISLTEGVLISDPPAGRLSFYAMEGDDHIFSVEEEFVRVDGGAGMFTLTDAANPIGNPFNGTINTTRLDPPDPDCPGGGICGAAGVDIDVFDIQPALAAGADSLHVQVGSGVDRVALANINLSVSVFGPVLDVDSRLFLLDGATEQPALAPLRYVAALSNTGNLPSTANTLRIHVPLGVSSFSIESLPAEARNESVASGGRHGRGIIDIRDIEVDVGQITDVRFSLMPDCGLRGGELQIEAEVVYEVDGFVMAAPPVLILDDPAGGCPPLGGPGEGIFWRELGLLLEGGGGCDAARSSNRGRPGGWMRVLGLLAMAGLGLRMWRAWRARRRWR